MYNNKFIVAFEGIPRSGKTKQCEMLRDYLNENGYRVRVIHEEHDPKSLTEKMHTEIKKIFPSDVNNEGEDEDELHAFFHKYKRVAAAYDASKEYFDALSKDYAYEILIYDGYKYLDIVHIQYYFKEKNEQLIDFLSGWLPDPDLMLYLDMDLDTAVNKIKAEKEKIRWYESQKYLSFMIRSFNHILDNFSKEKYILDAKEDKDFLKLRICKIVEGLKKELSPFKDPAGKYHR